MQVCCAKAISLLYKNDGKLLLRISLIMYVVLLTYSALNMDFKISMKNELYNENEVSSQITNVYSYNLDKMLNGQTIFDKEKLEIINYINDNLKDEITKDNVQINSGYLEKIWIYSWFSVKEDKDFYFDDDRTIEDFLEDDKEYLIYFNRNDEEDLSAEGNILFENNAGFIIRK